MTWYTVTEYQWYRRPRKSSHFPSAQFRRSFHDLSTRVTRMVSLMEHPTSLIVIIGFYVSQSLVFCLEFYRPLFAS
jgi:hypothetical protein